MIGRTIDFASLYGLIWWPRMMARSKAGWQGILPLLIDHLIINIARTRVASALSHPAAPSGSAGPEPVRVISSGGLVEDDRSRHGSLPHPGCAEGL
jgi:hypothetical protein